jgi:hypothetical protein
MKANKVEFSEKFNRMVKKKRKKKAKKGEEKAAPTKARAKVHKGKRNAVPLDVSKALDANATAQVDFGGCR